MSKETDAKIDLAYCDGFNAGCNAANNINLSASLINSIELRRLEALRVIKLQESPKEVENE